RDAALALAEHLAWKGVRIHLNEEDAGAQRPRGLIGKTTGERRLPGSGRTRENDESVDRKAHGVQTGAVLQREQREVEQPLLGVVGHDDARPAALPGRIG